MGSGTPAREVLLFLERNLLLVSIVAALALAVCVPGPGIALKPLGVSGLITFVVFLLQGLSIDAKSFLKGGRMIPLFAWSIVLAYVLAPLLGYAFSAAFGLKGDDLVGLMLICSMTPTIASGVVIAGRAGGETTTALALTVFLVFVGMLLIPYTLSLVLSRTVAISVADLAIQLALTVLVPTALSQAARAVFPALVARPGFRRFSKGAPAVLIGLTVYLSLAPQAARLVDVTAARLLVQVLAAFLVHGALLGSGYAVSRKLLAVDRPKSLSLAFVCSQKSLAMGAPIWGTQFAGAYPQAILPLIIFHAFQIVMDGFVATRTSRSRP